MCRETCSFISARKRDQQLTVIIENCAKVILRKYASLCKESVYLLPVISASRRGGAPSSTEVHWGYTTNASTRYPEYWNWRLRWPLMWHATVGRPRPCRKGFRFQWSVREWGMLQRRWHTFIWHLLITKRSVTQIKKWLPPWDLRKRRRSDNSCSLTY